MSDFNHQTTHETTYKNRERQEHRVFQKLLDSVPGLEECLLSSEEELGIVAELVSPASDLTVAEHNS